MESVPDFISRDEKLWGIFDFFPSVYPHWYRRLSTNFLLLFVFSCTPHLIKYNFTNFNNFLSTPLFYYTLKSASCFYFYYNYNRSFLDVGDAFQLTTNAIYRATNIGNLLKKSNNQKFLRNRKNVVRSATYKKHREFPLVERKENKHSGVKKLFFPTLSRISIFSCWICVGSRVCFLHNKCSKVETKSLLLSRVLFVYWQGNLPSYEI